jgi:negative regulator of sigma E activity
MNDALKLQISAFVDGELPENESELLLRRLSQDIALRQQVAQYLEIGRLIRREPGVPGMKELRDRIAAALGEEPVQHTTVPDRQRSRFTRPAVGVAIAASVAVMALIGLRQVYLPGESQNIDDDYTVRTVPDSRTAVDQADNDLLEQFYLHHDPRLVTAQYQEQDGSFVQVEADVESAEADETSEDEGSQD